MLEAQAEKNRERVVDERLDPYSGRVFPQEPRTTQLVMLIRQEQAVEDIVRARTWGVVRDRCGVPVEDWRSALGAWRREKAARSVGDDV